LARASEIVIWTVVMGGYSENSLNHTQETGQIGYITPAARPCEDDPTVTMREFPHGDRLIINAQRGQCFPRADSWGRRAGRSAAAWPDCISAWSPARTMSVNAGDMVAKRLQSRGQRLTGHVARQPHVARISSRTKCSRMIFGACPSSK
jgi:hypothetical protein